MKKILIASFLLLSGCSPSMRLTRILEKNPELLKLFGHDTTIVHTYQSKDSTFIFTKTQDTIRTEFTTVYRNNDTIRIRSSCPPCTTTIKETYLQPQKSIRTIEGQKWTFRQQIGFLILILSVYSIGLFIGYKFFKR